MPQSIFYDYLHGFLKFGFGSTVNTAEEEEQLLKYWIIQGLLKVELQKDGNLQTLFPKNTIIYDPQSKTKNILVGFILVSQQKGKHVGLE